jgi:uncharacterized membrane protein
MKKAFATTVFLLSFLLKSVLAAVPAGTVISNTATVTYKDSSGFSYSALSNTVEVVVAPVYGISITPDYQDYETIQGSLVNIPYLLKNSGNAKDSYSLNLENLPGDTGDLDNLKLYIDQNKNGLVDAGEPLYDNSSPPKLEPNEVLSLVVAGEISPSAATGTYKVALNGKSNGDKTKEDLNNVAVIKVESKGFVLVNKECDKTELAPGELLSCRINFKNPGTTSVRG